ncbi:solute carrier family 23 member 3 [Sorex fumeus]|uniref:solute carrier family 23 member 3 n=1 Tax=Sorex fumeus TaxID=62283 RepID=UPI0024AE49A5|nr:solute carrier family 23 member 3 [Sorex fumeus]
MKSAEELGKGSRRADLALALLNELRAARAETEASGSMRQPPIQDIPLQSEGPWDAQSPQPLLSAAPMPSSPSRACPRGSPPPWGLSCLLALQHLLVLVVLLSASHLLLLQSLPPGGLSYAPAQLLASCLFSCGLTTTLQTWMGSRLPLVQAPSFEFLVPALVLTSQKPPLAIRTPENSSLVLHLCATSGCPGLERWDSSLREVSGAVVASGLLQGALGLAGGPGHVFPRCGPLVLAPSLMVAGLAAHREVALFCSTHWGLALLLILLLVVCSQHLGNCPLPRRLQRAAPASPIHSRGLTVKVFSVLMPVAAVWVVAAFLGFNLIPRELSSATPAPWLWMPHPAAWRWPLLTPRALAAGVSMALAASTSSLGCYGLCGRLLRWPAPPPHACSRGLSLEGLGSALAGLLGSPLGIASSFPNLGAVGLIQDGSQRMVYVVGLLSMGLGLSPRLAQFLATIPLPVLGGVLGVTQAVVLSAGFSIFYLTDIDSGRNVFIVGFSIFMALLLPRWLREAPVALSTGWNPLDVFLSSLLTQPIFLAGVLAFLLENTVPGTQLERGLVQELPLAGDAQEPGWSQKASDKAEAEYELPFPLLNLCPCLPQPLRCLCPQPENSGAKDSRSSEPGERANLLTGLGEQRPGACREFRS